eukprot:13404552-Alexandrium_andersonii.AAC.1
MSTSSTPQPASRSMADRPSFRRPGPEKRCRHRGAPPLAAGGSGSSLTGTKSGGILGGPPSH